MRNYMDYSEQYKIDVDFMREALLEAQAALDEGEVPVGAMRSADGGCLNAQCM